MAIAHTLAVDRLRHDRGSGRPLLVLVDEMPEPAPFEEEDALIERETARRALAGLSASEQQLLTLAYFGGWTAREIAEKMGLKPDEVLKIAKEFGITIADGIQQGIDARPRPTIMSPSSPVQYQQQITSPSMPGYYNGGIYPGYTPGRDIGYIGISGGEAIMRPEWTRAVGPGFVDKMNMIARSGGVAAVQAAMGRYMGGFAGGGVAGAYRGAPQVVTVPVSTTIERNTPWTIQKAYFTDPAAAERFGDRSRARANRFGG